MMRRASLNRWACSRKIAKFRLSISRRSTRSFRRFASVVGRVLRMAAPRIPKILSPAGDADSLEAALSSGADAVYFGLDSGFNARARATNFALADLAETVAKIHRVGAEAYLTLNTLVFESELENVAATLREVQAAGVDAIIIQDPAVALIAAEVAPGLSLHASTQMTIAHPDAQGLLSGLGISRVVLPRELSVAEIGKFLAATEIETEVFIHGALCVSWSGQCLTSETRAERSANRGQCAQSCRLPYDLILDGRPTDLGDLRYLLSPKDLAGARAVPELARLGVHSFKIEGRQKGPAYVATATRGYRDLVDDLGLGRPPADYEARFQSRLADMALTYSRGFSDGWLAGSDHQSLVEGRFPKHRGLPLGRVVKIDGRNILVVADSRQRPWTGNAVSPERPHALGEVASALFGFGSPSGTGNGPAPAAWTPAPGTGVVFERGESERKDEPGGPLFGVRATPEGLWLGFGHISTRLRDVQIGDWAWATRAAADPLARSHTEDPEGRRRIDLVVSGRLGAPLTAQATEGQRSCVVSSEANLIEGRKAGLNRELLIEKLAAFGGTPYRLGDLDLSGLAAGLFLPPSRLKDLRRQLLAGLAIPGTLDPKPTARLATTPDHDSLPVPSRPWLHVLCRNEAQLEAALAGDVDEIELDWMELSGLSRAVERVISAHRLPVLATLRVEKPGEEAFGDKLRRLPSSAMLVRHWAEVMRRKDRPRHGDWSLNVTNSTTARHLFGLGLDTLTLSHDLDLDQARSLLRNSDPGRFVVVLHSHIPAFHAEHCVYSHLLSAGRDHHSCGRPCERHEIALRDERSRSHPVIVDAGCRNTVFHADPQTSAAAVPLFQDLGVMRFRIELVRESAERTAELIRVYRSLLRGELSPTDVARTLRVQTKLGLLGGPVLTV